MPPSASLMQQAIFSPHGALARVIFRLLWLSNPQSFLNHRHTPLLPSLSVFSQSSLAAAGHDKSLTYLKLQSRTKGTFNVPFLLFNLLNQPASIDQALLHGSFS
jgi:hypothetical protein